MKVKLAYYKRKQKNLLWLLGITGLLKLSVTKSGITDLFHIKLPVNWRQCAIIETVLVRIWEGGCVVIRLI